jgi:hypothetical protein
MDVLTDLVKQISLQQDLAPQSVPKRFLNHIASHMNTGAVRNEANVCEPNPANSVSGSAETTLSHISPYQVHSDSPARGLSRTSRQERAIRRTSRQERAVQRGEAMLLRRSR